MSNTVTTSNNQTIRGAGKVRVDEKGRLAMPALFRDFLQRQLPPVLTFHPHGCLVIYTGEHFEEIARQFSGMGNAGYLDAHMEEVIIGCAENVALDKTGRLMIHGHLRERANIRRDVLLFGVGDGIHVWDEERWEKRHLMLLTHLQDAGMSEEWKKLRI